MTARFQIYIVLGFLLLLFACKQEQAKFELIDPNISGVTFSNTIYETDSIHYFNFPYIYTGGGVGIADFNNDGLQDIFFSGNMVSSGLYLNKGDFQFDDITENAGLLTQNWATGVSIVDINQDGWMDIYLCVSGYKEAKERRNRLFINNGLNNSSNITFTESAAEYGIADDGHSTQSTFFDYDLDGDLDLYVMTHANEDYAAISKLYTHKDGSGLSTDRLYQNIGQDSLEHPFYQNVSKEAGILTEGYGLGLSISDLNQDGWPDIYVANDFIANDLMYINNQDGTFSNKLSDYTQHTSQNGMGVDIADINLDGLPDIMVMDMLPESNLRQKTMTANMNYNYFKRTLKEGFSPQFIRNTLQLHRGIYSNGEPTFSEMGRLAGVHQTDWSWAPLFADFDNDGLLDLYITNGFRRDVTDHDFQEYHTQALMMEKGTGELSIPKVLEQLFQLDSVYLPNYMFENKGNLHFDDQTSNWGLTQPSMSNGSAYADFDNDGDLDLVINNINSPAFLYQNQTQQQNPQHFIRISLEAPSPNIHAIGAKIIVHNSQREMIIRENYYTRGYLSSVERNMHIGLGADSLVEKLEIIWPDGAKELYTNLKADSLYEFVYGEGEITEQNVQGTSQPLFESANNEVDIHYQHIENQHSDFNLEPLIPHLYDYQGSGIAIGDINSDGMDDFYVGGARNQAGVFFIQQLNGQFTQQQLPESEKYEDMGALLLDVDLDEDLDLFVVSGGSSVKYFQKGHYQDRLYLNDGKGNFSISTDALPEIPASGSCVTAADYDQDGDLDLFVGGRIVPGKFPEFPRSYILENKNGIFEDATSQVAPELAKIGLVTAALWTDYDNDYDLDLIVVGEWMPITVFKNQKGELTKIKPTFSRTGQPNSQLTSNQTSGFWNSITGADIDADGDIDYIVGNLGENTAFKVSQAEPLKVYAKDFDQNGSIDAIMTRFIQGKEYPVAPRGVMSKQIESIRRLFPNYRTYSEADIHQILPAYDTSGIQILESAFLASSYIENLGNGNFTISPLPIEAQMGPLFGLEIRDVNIDGHLDVLAVGNFTSTEVISGWLDAHKGIVLFGDGNGGFKSVPPAESGFWIDGDARAFATLYTEGQGLLSLVSVSNDSLKIVKQANSLGRKHTRLAPDEIFGEVKYKNGKKRKLEFYFGQGYLSQPARLFEIGEDVESIKIHRVNRVDRHVEEVMLNEEF